MTTDRGKWMYGWILAMMGCEPLPGSDEGEVTGGSEVSTGEYSGTTAGESTVSNATFAESSSGTGSTSVGDTSGCSNHGEETSTTGTSTTVSSSDTGGGESGGSAAEQCGVELVFDGSESLFECGCEQCSIDYPGISPASGEALLNACDCICDVFDCGGSITGGVTTNDGEEGASGETGGSEVSGGEYEESGSDTDSGPVSSTTIATGG